MNFTEAEYRRLTGLLERLVAALEAEVAARREDREKQQLESHRAERITASVLIALVFAAFVAYVYRGPVSPIVQSANVPALALGVTVITALGALVFRAIRMGTISLSYAMFTVGMLCSYAGLAVLVSSDPASPYLSVVCGWSLFWFWFRTYATEDIVDGKAWYDRWSKVIAVPVGLGTFSFLWVLTLRAVLNSWLTAALLFGGLVTAVLGLVLIAWAFISIRNAIERGGATPIDANGPSGSSGS